MKKSVITQSIVNSFPDWSAVRTNDQSTGYQLINTLAKPLGELDIQLEKAGKNAFLSTANLDEIDIVYKIDLTNDFNFTIDTTDKLNPKYIQPTVEGLIDEEYIEITSPSKNTIEEFWYNSIPTRATLETVVSGENYILTTLDSTTDLTWSGELTHHMSTFNDGGDVFVETANGTQYIRRNEEFNRIDRAILTIEGVTRKGTTETESFAFGWDDKQKSLKQWKRLNKINLSNFPEDITIQIRSGDFNSGPYYSFFNLRYSEDNRKIDEFWDINTETGTTTFLERIGHISADWRQLVQGFSEKEVKESWELLDSDSNPIIAVDIAIQPFTNRAWVLDSSGVLYCYDLDEEMVENIDWLKSRTPNSDVVLYTNSRHIVLGDDISFQAQHLRIFQEVASYQLWYKDPDGTITYVTDDVVVPSNTQRTLSDEVVITPTKRGEWLFGLDGTMADGTIFKDRVIVSVQYKLPLTQIDLSDLISLEVSPAEIFSGLDFDTDQKLWIFTSGGAYTYNYYKINLHTDIMLIDYDNKLIYFKEEYDDIRITT